LQLPLYVRCEDGFVTYKLSILTVFVTRRNVIEKRTVVIETPETFADFVIPYSDRDYRVDVFAVNKQKIVSERNFTATLILRPGLPPADTDSNKGLSWRCTGMAFFVPFPLFPTALFLPM
jgi:hypothetical protein